MGVDQVGSWEVVWASDLESASFEVSVSSGVDPGRAVFTLPRGSRLWAEGSTTIALVGEVYGDPEAVPALFAKDGVAGLCSLHGSFLIFVSDERSGEAWVVNDHIGSRAAYIWETDGGALVTNSLTAGTRFASELDPGGIGSYLANDGVRAGLTPWGAARSLAPGSFQGLHRGGEQRRYWQMQAIPETGDTEELAEVMHGLMLAAVERRLAPFEDTPILLSLSGGVDSKGLLGLLLDHVPADRVSAYTYFHGEQVGDMDLPGARRAASIAGVSHHPIAGFDGDFLTTLVDNAIRGDAAAHYCDDADAWRSLGAEYGRSRLVVAGDRQAHHLGRLPDDLPIPSLLRLVSLYPGSVIEWFLGSIPSDAGRAVATAWDEAYSAVVADYSSLADWRLASHPAYIEQRANPTLTLWRERFSSQAGRVISPFLDRDLLDFVGRLPTALNDVEGDFLHRITLERAYPRIFSGDNAHGGWNVPDWGEEIRRNSGALRSLILGVDSPLESLVPKDVTLRLLEAVASSHSPVGTATSGWRWHLRKLVKSSDLLTRLARERKLQRQLRAPMKVGESTLLRRLLTLHLALADRSAVMERFEEVRKR